MWDHTVLPATRQRLRSRPYPSRLGLVLDLATPEGCKAELTQSKNINELQRYPASPRSIAEVRITPHKNFCRSIMLADRLLQDRDLV